MDRTRASHFTSNFNWNVYYTINRQSKTDFILTHWNYFLWFDRNLRYYNRKYNVKKKIRIPFGYRIKIFSKNKFSEGREITKKLENS